MPFYIASSSLWPMIDINNITIRMGSKTLLENASAHISDGQKVGLVGANGCGKSTLFKVLQGEMETETGDIYFPSSYKVAVVKQEMNEVETPIIDHVLSQDKELTELTNSLLSASDMEVPEIMERLNILEAASAEGRAAAILSGLGFKNEDLKRPIKEFSGGWRMRLALAAVLFQPSDILLLDEPTNHLDLETTIWLEGHLRRYKGTLILISHDREILNSLCDYIIHFEGKKLNSYGGNYDTFQKTRAMQRQLLSKQAEKQEKRRQHLQSFVDRFRYKATKAKQAQSRIKMLEKLEEIPELEADISSHFAFPNPEKLAPPYISMDNVVVGYDGKPVLSGLNMQIVDNDRIAMLGSNGNGKSTLAKLISGKLKEISGSIHRSSKVRVGYFAQHQAEELPLDETAYSYMASIMPLGTLESRVRAHLAQFGLDREKALTKIENLSGGEKARLLFAAMTYDAPALLILDEPTNHLDIPGRDALVDAVNSYTGSVILITHDLNLIQLIADTLWLVKDGKCKEYDGDLEDYKKLVMGSKKSVEKEKGSPADKDKIREKKTMPKEPEVVKISFQEKKNLKSQILRLEKKLAKLNQQKAEMEAKFLEQMEAAMIMKLQKDLAYIANEIAETEEEWLKLSEQIEA